MISYGQLYISNPDLAERLINKWPINKNIDWKTVYTPGAKGYTDYPFSPMNKQQV
jgi:N-ethylmaleimide reductase